MIMEHTANFLHEGGPEGMAILRKQQAENTNFLFLLDGHPLNPFLQFLGGSYLSVLTSLFLFIVMPPSLLVV